MRPFSRATQDGLPSLCLLLSVFGFATVRSVPTEEAVYPSLHGRSDPSVLAGYHVIFSWPGTPIPQELFNLTQEGKVGGIILFGENVDDDLPGDIADLQQAYKASPSYLGSPLLVLTDQEGGEVVRLPGGPKRSEKMIGSLTKPASAASRAGGAAAKACTDFNVNGNLAPVLGVFRQTGDFLDEFQRSYSMNASIARECGAAFIEAQQPHKIVATAKHFPGLGAASASQNTDAAPVTLNVSLEDLRSIDEVPFVGAIAAGVDMIMPSWALYPAFDAARPSGLSAKWLKQELRRRLGFRGVLISDAIEAGALEAFGTDPDRAVLAVEAGMDIVLASARNITQGVGVVDALAKALQNGTLSTADFMKSTSRIVKLRSSLPAV